MTFTPGHVYYPPKNGNLPGRNRSQARASRLLSSAVRDHIEADALALYHFAIACGHMNVRLTEDGKGVSWNDESGIPPTQSEISESVKWLSDRGWGQPAQSVHVEASFRAELAGAEKGLAITSLPASTLHAMSELLAGTRARERALPPASIDDATDAEFTESPASSAGADDDDQDTDAPA